MRQILWLGLIILLIIMIPFVLWHEPIEAWAQQWMQGTSFTHGWTFGLVFSLLMLDILLPVPSSLVSTGGGMFLGIFYGTLVSFLGMTAGCTIGYYLGKGSGKKMTWLKPDSRKRMEVFFQKNGIWSMVLARPVPVLAESSVLFAGISNMDFRNFVFTTGLSNLAISFVYATIGAYAVNVNSFLLAFAGAIVLPLVVKFALTIRKR
jgi:uncharacterized membrane protein YdjX (TVP38/TMEM64 family)